jgi:hypothetical protein
MQTEEIMFSSNIEVLRDIGASIDLKYMSNDGNFRWTMTKSHHVIIEITHHTSKNYKLIYLEFCGDGIVRVHGINHDGFDLGVKLFDTHWFTGIESIRDGFRKFLLSNFGYHLL